jgi:hypothetical protein
MSGSSITCAFGVIGPGALVLWLTRLTMLEDLTVSRAGILVRPRRGGPTSHPTLSICNRQVAFTHFNVRAAQRVMICRAGYSFRPLLGLRFPLVDAARIDDSPDNANPLERRS